MKTTEEILLAYINKHVLRNNAKRVTSSEVKDGRIVVTYIDHTGDNEETKIDLLEYMTFIYTSK